MHSPGLWAFLGDNGFALNTAKWKKPSPLMDVDIFGINWIVMKA